ncbi:hypothetical protein SteCoe_16811 [Stentor coeruleus]|uniref:Uncharacterized protein n=1 Tax=Stentor coeruleus TaxID=5963 RepID=A0A1R2C0K3_9CILI|nr:hypothetical protein SteCoe_16811 [Stentor coeruleus]
MQRSPSGPVKIHTKYHSSHNSSQNSSQGSFEDKTQPGDSEAKSTEKIHKKFNLTEMSKLAVPYQAMSEIIQKVMSQDNSSSIIPIFPLRHFGEHNDINISPKFKVVEPSQMMTPIGKKEILKIKQRSGRNLSTRMDKLPPLYSPRPRGNEYFSKLL